MAEIDILWITAGLGCDGDTVAMTAATLPSLEDVARNDALAATNRRRLAERGVVAVNVLASPARARPRCSSRPSARCARRCRWP